MNLKECPEEIIFVGHAKTVANAQKIEVEDATTELGQQYATLKTYFNNGTYRSAEASQLAHVLAECLKQQFPDSEIPLAPGENDLAKQMGERLSKTMDITTPEIVVLPPTQRHRETFVGIKKGWIQLDNSTVYEDTEARKQDFGAMEEYAYFPPVYFALNPGEYEKSRIEGRAYRPPGGENEEDTLERQQRLINKYADMFPGKSIMFISSRTAIAESRRYLEGSSGEFDHNKGYDNLGVWVYSCQTDPVRGKRFTQSGQYLPIRK